MDSEADRDIIQRAIEDGGIPCICKEVNNGEQLLSVGENTQRQEYHKRTLRSA